MHLNMREEILKLSQERKQRRPACVPSPKAMAAGDRRLVFMMVKIGYDLNIS